MTSSPPPRDPSLDPALRDALAHRAATVNPSSDLLAQVERRAGRIRRHRALAAIAGAVVSVMAVVAVVAVGVPLLGGGTDRASRLAAPHATSQLSSKSPQPEPLGTSGGSGFNPDLPWEYRGDPVVEHDLNGAAVAVWSNRHAVDDVRVASLFGQVDESSRIAELVLVLTTDRPYLVVARALPPSSDPAAGPRAELLVDEPLPNTPVLAVALPGDGGGRLLVVAAPDVTTLQYVPGSASALADLTSLAPGVATAQLTGDPATDVVRAATSDGRQIYRGPAPDLAVPKPANALDWPARGRPDPALEGRAVAAFVKALVPPNVKGNVGPVGHTVLFTGRNDARQRYVVLQAWVNSGPAHSFGYVETPGREPESLLQPTITPDDKVVAVLLTPLPGRTSDQLVVVPAPGTDVQYRATRGGRFVLVSPARVPGPDGVTLIDRAPGADGDAIRLLAATARANDTLPFPVVTQQTVSHLLCMTSKCS